MDGGEPKPVSSQKEIMDSIVEVTGMKQGSKVLDVGIGTDAHSTKRWLETGADVVGVDVDVKCEVVGETMGFPIMICDAVQLPFEDGEYDWATAMWVLHEVDGEEHRAVLKEMARVAKGVVIAEPLAKQDEVGILFDRLWKHAMESVGLVEEYWEAEHWRELLADLGLKIIYDQAFQNPEPWGDHDAHVLEEKVVNHFRDKGVGEEGLTEASRVVDEVRKRGMKRGAVLVLVAVRE